MRSRAFSIAIFLIGAGLTTGFFALTNTPGKNLVKRPTEVSVYSRTAQAQGLVLGDSTDEASFELAGLSYGSTATWYGAISSGDGVYRTQTFFDFPEDITRDKNGNYYIADTWNHRIRKINSSGTVTTLAGSSHGWYEHTGTRAKFAYPRGVAVDSSGNVYVADSGNGRIRKVSPQGTTSTLVSGLNNPEGVTVYGSTLYIAETGANRIRKVSTSGSGFSTLSTSVSQPKKLVVSGDGRTLYIANAGTHQIVQVRTSTGATSVLSGSGASGTVNGSASATRFVSIRGLTLVGRYLYIAENNGLKDYIRRVDALTGASSTITSDTTGEYLSYVAGMTTDGSYVYIANSGSGRIERYSVSKPSIHHTYAGSLQYLERNGAQSSALIGRPTALHFTANKAYMYMVTNNQFKRIRMSDGRLEYVIGNVADNYREGIAGNTDPAESARFSSPFDFAINNAGTTIYLSDRWNNRIRKVNLSASPVSSSYITGAGRVNMSGGGSNGYQEGRACSTTSGGVSGCAYFTQPTGVALSPDEKYLYVADTGNHRIRRVELSTGKTTLVAGSSRGYADGRYSAARFNSPYGLVIDSRGENLYVADRDNHRIRKIRLSDNTVTTIAGSGANGHRDAQGTQAVFSLPLTLALDTANHLYVSDVGALKIRVIDLSNNLVHTVTGSGTRGYEQGGRTSSQFNNPEGMIADVSSGKLYVADTWNDVIRTVGIAESIPYLDPAPVPTEVRPGQLRQSSSASAYVDLFGSGFRYGTETYVGTHKVTTYPKSSTNATLVLPISAMRPGWYDVRTVNFDLQARVKERAFAITDGNGNIPNITYHTPAVGNTSSGVPLDPNFFTGKTATFHDVDNIVTVKVPGNALSYNAFVRVIRSSDAGLPDNPGWIPASATREFQAIKTSREILSVLDTPVTTTFKYDPNRLPVEEQTLNLFYYKPEIGRWVGVHTDVDPIKHTVTAYHRGSSVRLKLWGKPKGDTSINNLKLPPLSVNYYDKTGGTFSNTSGAVVADFPQGSIQQDAFVRVFESYDHDLNPNTGWQRVSLVRHFQALTTNRQLIKQLRFPVKITATYQRDRLGSVKEDSLTLFYYSFDLNRWVGLTTTVDPKTQTVSARYITPNVRLAIFGKT